MKKEKNGQAKIKGKAGFITWSAVSLFLVVLCIVVSILTTGPFYDIICIVLGGERANYVALADAPYTADYDSKAEVLAAANELNEEVCEEGFVLLKNEGALPLKTPESDSSILTRPKVSIFGKNSVNLAYGGSGSGGGSTGSARTIYQSLQEAGYDTNSTLEAFYKDNNRSGSPRTQNTGDLDSGDTVTLSTGETPQERYGEDVKSSYSAYSDAAIVVITRIGGEGFDLPRTMKGASGARNESDHYLQLDKNETDLLEAVCAANFEHVIVVINSGAAMELGFLKLESNYAYEEKIDAAILMGFPGNSGVMALGRILNGTVNPSGRTVDTYATDLKKDPTWNNFGDNLITGNMQTSPRVQGGDQYVLSPEDRRANDDGLQLFYFVDYEEGVYVGYKYYETRGYTENQKDGATEDSWYNENVVYPMGYGLSYTNFEWTVDASAIENKTITADGKYEVKVTVKNVGKVAGKDVVQLYVSAPYTAGGIEKPYKVLSDFAKTSTLEPNASETVVVTLEPYYVASYDYLDANQNGFKGYELDGGEYQLFVAKNAHESVTSCNFSVVPAGIKYTTDPVTGTAVVNRYTDQEQYFNSNEQLSTVLSRSDWEGTWPTAPTDEERTVRQEFIDALNDTSTNNPTDYSQMEMPWFDEDAGLTFRDILTTNAEGKVVAEYDDPLWEELLSQCSVDELIYLCDAGGFKTARIDSIGKAATNDTDGPAGFTNFMDRSGTYYDTCYYCCETVMSATWNTELIERLGAMVGNEGLIGATEGAGNGLPYSGWYAPGVNIHRSAFGGRNFEYFSEDGVLSGKMAAAEIKGCQSKGVYCYVKHFALNEQETHRSIGGNVTWVTEQAMREIFLRPFEIAVKEGGARAMMSSFTRIGTRWTGGDYRLLTEILRNEWGFKGMVITDFNTIDYLNTRQMAYAGGDLNLIALTGTKLWADPSDTGDMIVLMQNAKNILYTVANSNAMCGEVLGYKLPYWQIGVIALDSVVGVAVIVWGVFAVRGFLKYRRQKHTPQVTPTSEEV